jgi:hypothetical protein
MNNKPKLSNEAGPPASISRNPPVLTIHLTWSEARLVRDHSRLIASRWLGMPMLLQRRLIAMLAPASTNRQLAGSM